MVVIFSGFSFIANAACFIVLCIDLCNGNYYQELQQSMLNSGESLSSVSTLPYSPYGDHSTRADLAIPRIKSLQLKQHFKPDDRISLARSNGVGPYPGGQKAGEQRGPSGGLNRSLTNRPSLPIVIRKNTSFIYFY